MRFLLTALIAAAPAVAMASDASPSVMPPPAPQVCFTLQQVQTMMLQILNDNPTGHFLLEKQQAATKAQTDASQTGGQNQ